jgi:CRP/FNR family transcriptional regulator, dissimilatory nitrate respiration regulator
MDLTYLLRSCRLFADMDRPDLEIVQRMAARKEFGKGDLIFNEGDPSRAFYLVITGAVKIYRIGPDGRERVLHVVEPGAAFAVSAMFMPAHPATAEALLGGTTLIAIEKNGFKQLLAADPRLSFKIIGTLVQWMNQMRDALTDLTLKEVPARFASYVLSLNGHANGNGNGHVNGNGKAHATTTVNGRNGAAKSIHVSITKTTIAQMLGTTKETLSRVLGRLEESRIIRFHGHNIQILNRDRLTKIAGGEEKV